MPRSRARGHTPVVTTPLAPTDFQSRNRSVVLAARDGPTLRLGSATQARGLIERYVPGAEVAVEGLLRAGSLEPLAVFDKPDALEGPYFEETILDLREQLRVRQRFTFVAVALRP